MTNNVDKIKDDISAELKHVKSEFGNEINGLKEIVKEDHKLNKIRNDEAIDNLNRIFVDVQKVVKEKNP